jgi:ActR/RegA family two-component response regulator
MNPLSVVIVQKNSAVAQNLARSLNQHFKSVRVARGADELARIIPGYRAELAVLDLEVVDLNTVAELHNRFRDTLIVCTHRLADESLWASALSAGAVDCCYDSDVRGIVMAVHRHFGMHAA